MSETADPVSDFLSREQEDMAALGLDDSTDPAPAPTLNGNDASFDAFEVRPRPPLLVLPRLG